MVLNGNKIKMEHLRELNNKNMQETISADEFKKKYGQKAIDKFSVGQTISADEFNKAYQLQDQTQRASALQDFQQGLTGGLVGRTFGRAAETFTGTAGKTIGELGLRGVGAGIGLYGQATNQPDIIQRGAQIEKAVKGNITPVNIAMTGLELYPGGGELKGLLSKVPGGGRILEYITKSVPESLKAQAVKTYYNLLKPTGQEAKAIAQKVAPEMAERGIKFSSTEALEKTAENELLKAGANIDKYLDTLSVFAKEKVKPIAESITNYVQENAYVGGKIIRQELVNAGNKVLGTLKQYGDFISTKGLRELRQIWDEYYKSSKGLDDIVTYTKKIERVGANAIRQEFSKTRPEMQKLNAEFNFWRGVYDIAKADAEKVRGRTTGAIAGGITGIALGEGILGRTQGAIIGGWLGKRAIELFQSPAWRSLSAAEKNKIADYLIKGDFNSLEMITSKAIAGSHNIFEGLSQ